MSHRRKESIASSYLYETEDVIRKAKTDAKHIRSYQVKVDLEIYDLMLRLVNILKYHDNHLVKALEEVPELFKTQTTEVKTTITDNTLKLTTSMDNLKFLLQAEMQAKIETSKSETIKWVIGIGLFQTSASLVALIIVAILAKYFGVSFK
jgi:uncharacterized protein YabN with tetrapyrrole methylase and pyrophosphatase domain